MREQGRSKTGIASLLHVKLAPMSAPDPTGERQEHLDAIISFAGVGQRRRLCRGLDILTIKWAIGDLPEECRFLLNTQLMFLKKEKDPTTKLFDDDEWIRASRKSPQTSRKTVSCMTSKLSTRKRFGPSKWENSRKYVSRTTPGGGAEALAIFHQLIYDECNRIPERAAGQDQSRRSAQGSSPFPSQAQSSGGMEASELVAH